ncbi:MAG: FecR domain-containing protein [Opitutaceae bacterium]
MSRRLSDREVALAASGWIVRSSRGLTAEEQDEYSAWLAADPRHGVWLAKRRQAWSEFDVLTEWRPEHSAEPNPDLLAAPRQRRRPPRLAFLVALAAGVAVALVVLRRTPVEKNEPVAVVVAGYESRALDDGSVVELNGGAQIEVRFTADERRVRLVRGEAHFQVAKNPHRPFVVEAGEVAVRAVGTAFDVLLGGHDVEVLVTEGRVRVDPPAASAAASSAPDVSAGQRVVVALTGGQAPIVTAVSDEEIARRLAWQPRLLDFSATPLAEVAAEFNRRNRTQLVLADPALREMPIVASFRSDNLDGFVRMLELSAGVTAERTGDTVVLRRAPQAR